MECITSPLSLLVVAGFLSFVQGDDVSPHNMPGPSIPQAVQHNPHKPAISQQKQSFSIE